MLPLSLTHSPSLVTLHFAQILELQHLDVSTVVQLHNSLLVRNQLISRSEIKTILSPYLAVDGEQLSSHILVLVSQDHLHLVATAGNHRGQVISGDVDGPGEERL